MAPNGDAQAHAIDVCLPKIGQCTLRWRGYVGKVGVFTARRQGLQRGAIGPPHPGAAQGQVGTARVDPTPVGVGIDAGWCLPRAPWGYALSRYSTSYLAQIFKGLFRTRGAESVKAYVSALFAQAVLHVRSAGCGCQRGGLTWEGGTRCPLTVCREVGMPKRGIEGGCERGWEGVEHCRRPPLVGARWKFTLGLRRDRGTFPEYMYDGCMEQPAVRALAVRPSNIG